MTSARGVEIIKRLELKAHPEDGYYHGICRSPFPVKAAGLECCAATAWLQAFPSSRFLDKMKP